MQSHNWTITRDEEKRNFKRDQRFKKEKMIENFEKPITTNEDAKKSLTITKIGDGRGEESELEEGKILGVEYSDDPASEPMKTPYSKHPLQYSWTFWFDTPSAKYKQTAWGSNIRPVHTVSSVEDFWRYPLSLHFFLHHGFIFCIMWGLSLSWISFHLI